LYFISFILATSFVMINLFVLVLIDQFENYYINPDNPLQEFSLHLQNFKTTWREFSKAYGGEKMKTEDLPKLIRALPDPLGKKIKPNHDG
jgi:hypothetical protein